ncbi:MAG TPA: acyl-CoA dehydrogenase family protein [Candidatus Acidoferrales bacterium]|jgi:acyl-CoA dehydrogenase|nr:acyl-CoA dehydrogenase family protein [Candidatus Acidoferrales bacterium]
MPNYESPWMNEELRMFRKALREFIQEEFVPKQSKWREQHRPDVEAWKQAGATGLLLADIPEEYGGGGGTFAHNAVVTEELAQAGVNFGTGVQSIVSHYILQYGNEEQKKKWLPAMAQGELIGAIAMTEPSAGSDLQAIKTAARLEGNEYVISGSKTFITNGGLANLVCVAAKTNPKVAGFRGISMIVVETKNLKGYRVGKSLEKVGMHEIDTCELFFDDVRVPSTNLLGKGEGAGFAQMMDQLRYERLMIGVGAIASIERALDLTIQYAKERKAFGQTLMEFQNARFKLAQCKTEAQIGRVFIDNCVMRFLTGQLDPVTAAMAKYWTTECQCRIVDECVQLFGGYGYMSEYPIARMWMDGRVQRIYAGTNEILEELIGWSL